MIGMPESALHLLGAVTANSVGFYVGAALPPLVLAIGIIKCFTIARRPTTSMMSALALALALGAFLLSMIGGLGMSALHDALAPTAANAAIMGAVGITVAVLVVLMILAAMMLAILGLVNVHVQPQRYRQGARQSIAALVLAPALLMIFGIGAMAGMQRERQADRPTIAMNMPVTVVPVSPPPAASAPSVPTPAPTAPDVPVPATSPAPPPAQPVGADVFDMPELGFTFDIPPIPWIVTDSKAITPASCLGFLHARPSIFFVVIAEDMADEQMFDTAGLAEIAVANLKSVSRRCDVIERVPQTINNVPGIRVYTRATVAPHDVTYVHWVTVHNGYAYQLITAGGIADEAKVREAADAMHARWKPKAARSTVALQPIQSQYGYSIDIKAPGWRAWKTAAREMPDAEHGALLGMQTCMNVVPISLCGLDPDPRALCGGLVERFSLNLDKISNVQEVTNEPAGVTGSTFECTSLQAGGTFYYKFKVLRNRNVALLAAAWTQNTAERDRLPEALAGVRLDPAAVGPDVKRLRTEDKRRNSIVLNSIGLHHQERQKYDLAVKYLETASAMDDDPIILSNLILAYTANKQFAEAQACAVRGMTQHPQRPQFQAQAAFCLEQLGQTDRAIAMYARVFAGGYRDDSTLIGYQLLLEKAGKIDEAIAAGDAYLAHAPAASLGAALAHADLLARHGKGDRAIALLEEWHRREPTNPALVTVLSSHYVEALRYVDALNLLKPLREAADPPLDVLLVHGQAQAGLKQFREAKATFEAALNKSPSSTIARDWLTMVSGQLGEGANSAVKTPIEAVAVPAELLNPPADAVKVPADNSIYYISRVTGISFVPEKDYRQTEYRRVKIVDARGIESYSTAQFPFDSLSERMFVNKLEVRDENGKVLAVGKVSDAYVLDDQSGESVTYKKVLNIPVPALRAGCEVELIVTREDLSRPKEMPFYQHVLTAYMPAQRSALFVRGDLPSLKRTASGGVVAKEMDGGICWMMDDVPDMRYEPLQPPAVTFLPFVAVAAVGPTWESEAKSYLSMIADRLKPDPAAVELAQRLTTGMTSESDKVAALLRHVQQDYTYRAIEFGRRARVPLAAADIVHNHYGDCKDHSLLLHQLLGAIGVESQLALVNTYGPLRADMPSLDQFNHIIVCVPPAAGAGAEKSPWRFFDCTDKESDLRAGTVYSLVTDQVLLLDPAAPRLIDLPQPASEVGNVAIAREVKLGEQGEVAVSETITWTGYDAAGMRAMLRPIEPARRAETLKQMIGGERADVAITSSNITGLDDRTQPVVLQVSYTGGRRFSALTDQQQLIGSLPARWERYYLEADAVEKRRTPFRLRLPRSLRTSVKVHLPSGYRIGSLPKGESFDDAFRHGSTTWQASDGGLKLEFSVARKIGQHDAAAYDSYVQSSTSVMNLLESHLVLQKAGR
ncbi:MAG: hypothetical protein QOF78_1873 [Phycisphaerales bacterium]|jgi:tetratricopeptide (TPR) repeat protein|nr:hypothetical protein [Phycisphaerales bacterium]